MREGECPHCRENIEQRWLNESGVAGAYHCPCCSAELCATTWDDGCETGVDFVLVVPPLEGADA